jgi:SAM-dependent methyltransferase
MKALFKPRIERLKSRPSRQRGEFAFGKHVVEYTDPLSFYGEYKDIFESRIYHFEAKTPAPVIVDAGSCIGMSVLYFKSVYPGARVTAFEPDPEMCAVLRRNLERNGAADVRIVNAGLGAAEGTATFAADGADGGSMVTGAGIPEAVCDCFILTQTLPFLFDVRSAARHAVRALRPGGHLLVTVPGITQVSRYDMDRWGHFWSFTDLSLRRLFEEVVPAANVRVETHGNVKVAAAFLYGLPQHALTDVDYARTDPDYQVVITAVVRRP